MPTKLTRKDYAAVILALAGKPLHYNQDLNYIAETIRGENSENTPWNSMSTVLLQTEDRFVRTAGNGMFDLNIGENTDRRSFVLSKIGEEKYNTICELLRTHHFLDDSGNLVWTEQKNYRHTAADAPLQVDMPEEEENIDHENAYSRANFLSEVFISPEKYDAMVRRLKVRKNIILQGAPGVGKTFAAKRLAYSIMGEKDESRIEFVQFHQNYSYEDFVMGYKPKDDGFELKYGIFHSFCKLAAEAKEKDFFFIIDEINRGNMSKIFGELLMLIEKDYRGSSLTLAYDGQPFHVPENLHIIGMMNTADRSLAMIDYALRRRFSFFDMEPGFDSAGFKAYQKNLNHPKLDQLVEEIKALNKDIADDKSLGKGFCIGHSYLCGEKTCSEEYLQGVVEYDILPMLAEYWFDDTAKYETWAKRLTDVVK